MKNFYLTLALLLATTSALAADFHPEADETLEKENFWADVSFKPDSTVTTVNFRAWFQHPADKVFKLLIDTNGLPQVHSNYKDAAVIAKDTFDAIVAANPTEPEALTPLIKKIPTEEGRKPGNKWTRYEYLNFNFPWPLSNRWTVQKVKVDESKADSGVYRYDYTMSVGNFKALSGYWELVPVAGKPGWTEFRGHYESDAGIGLPKFVTKSAAKTGLKRDVEDNRRILAAK